MRSSTQHKPVFLKTLRRFVTKPWRCLHSKHPRPLVLPHQSFSPRRHSYRPPSRRSSCDASIASAHRRTVKSNSITFKRSSFSETLSIDALDNANYSPSSSPSLSIPHPSEIRSVRAGAFWPPSSPPNFQGYEICSTHNPPEPQASPSTVSSLFDDPDNLSTMVTSISIDVVDPTEQM